MIRRLWSWLTVCPLTGDEHSVWHRLWHQHTFGAVASCANWWHDRLVTTVVTVDGRRIRLDGLSWPNHAFLLTRSLDVLREAAEAMARGLANQRALRQAQYEFAEKYPPP